MKRLIKKSEDIFNVGDKVRYKTHPYDNTTIYEIKEVLSDGTYFFSNDETAYTGINGINLEKIEA